MTKSLEEEITSIVAKMDEQQNEQPPDTTTEQDEIQDIYVLIVRETEEEEEDQTQVVESRPTTTTTQQDSFLSTYVFVCCSLVLILAMLAFQCYCIMNPPIATVTIIPTVKTVTLSGTVQLGRVLPPLTISQSQTALATGRGDQEARAATGTVTFYNGLFTQQFVASGTVFTGQDGIAIVTTHDATIPKGDPSSGYGTLTVAAQAVAAGTSGNMQAGAMSITINNGLLVRSNQFSGGQDARTYTTVTQHDIHSISTVLKTSLTASMQGALTGQLQPNEQVYTLPCSPTVTSDHQAGEEATIVKVTVSQTCSAVAFNTQELATKATAFLTERARQETGAGYSVFGTIHMTVKQASVSSAAHPLVFLSFQATGTWIYALSEAAQQQIKHLIAGKTTQEAVQALAVLPGIERATLHFSGIGNPERVPKSTQYIHLVLLIL